MILLDAKEVDGCLKALRFLSFQMIQKIERGIKDGFFFDAW